MSLWTQLMFDIRGLRVSMPCLSISLSWVWLCQWRYSKAQTDHRKYSTSFVINNIIIDYDLNCKEKGKLPSCFTWNKVTIEMNMYWVKIYIPIITFTTWTGWPPSTRFVSASNAWLSAVTRSESADSSKSGSPASEDFVSVITLYWTLTTSSLVWRFLLLSLGGWHLKNDEFKIWLFNHFSI